MPLIILGVSMIGISALTLYLGYSAQDFIISGFGWFFILAGAIMTMLGISKLRQPDALSKDLQPEDADRRHVEIRALVQSMGVMAVADKKIHEAEVGTIARIHEQILGLTISHEEVYEILEEFVSGFDIQKSLTEKRGQISPDMKRKIIQCCHLVSVSDLEVADGEANKLMEIGTALGFDEEEIKDILAEVSV